MQLEQTSQPKVKGSSDRSFGIVFTFVFLVIALFPLISGGVIRWWAALIAFVFLAVSFVYPVLLAPLNRQWTRFGLLLHRITNPIILGLMFFLVITPTGFVVRAMRKDLLRLKHDDSLQTYWIDRSPPGPERDSLNEQF